MIFSTKPSRRETIWGGIYLIFYLFLASWLVPLVALFLAPQLNEAQVNFIYFILNFAATTLIFRKFILQSLKDAVKVPSRTLWYTILGYLGNQTLGNLVAVVILRLYPDFTSVNDVNIQAILAQDRQLMVVGAVLLAPIAEELLFRGLIFRGLYDRSPLAAHLVSMVLFSAIHVSGYIGYYEPELLFFCFIQYLPAAYCLNFAYRYSGTIAAPILMHILNNLAAFSAMR